MQAFDNMPGSPAMADLAADTAGAAQGCTGDQVQQTGDRAA